jgi:hypothetical protein
MIVSFHICKVALQSDIQNINSIVRWNFPVAIILPGGADVWQLLECANEAEMMNQFKLHTTYYTFSGWFIY